MAEDSKIITPATAKKDVIQPTDVQIHVMPKEFLGREASVKGAPAVVLAPAPIPQPPTTSPKLPQPPAPPVPKKKSRLPIVLLILGIFLLAVLGGGAYYILQGINQPVVEPEPQPEPEPEPEPEPVPVEITQGKDTDSDGLTDREESLYGTELRNPDTDGDTFLDGNEVFHRYDPLGYSPSTLLDTGSVVEFTSPDGAYTLTYPRTWTLTSTTDGLVVRAATTANIELSIAAELLTPEADWQEALTKNGYISYTSPEKREVYVMGEGQTYVFTYSLGDSTTIDYQQTFQMFVNSFMAH